MINRITLLGRLGADPESRSAQSGAAVCNMRIATNHRTKTADGQWEEATEWHRVVCFGRVAESCQLYLAKGRQVYIEGRIQTRKWQGKDGEDRYTVEVLANEVKFIGGKRADGERGRDYRAEEVADDVPF